MCPDITCVPIHLCDIKYNTVKLLNIRHLRVLKNLSVIERYPLLGGNLKKIVTIGTKGIVRYLGCPLLGGFTVFHF